MLVLMVRGIGVDSYTHVYNRGVKKMPIFRQKGDLWRLLASLYYFNHAGRMPENWKREIEISGDSTRFEWPEAWGERHPIVSILAFSIMPNHLHLMIKEIVEGGTSKFMHRISMAHSKFINEKYGESGSLFESAFKSRLVEDDNDFRNLAVYIMVKNPFERYSGGLKQAVENFNDAYERVASDPFSSLGSYAGNQISPILEKDLLGELFETPESFKDFARESMEYRLDQLISDFSFVHSS